MEERLTHLSDHSALFSHDGIHDSQTHLAAPPFFYEQLRREVAHSMRTQMSFSAVKITFMPRIVDGERPQLGAEDILRFSCELRSLIRGSECIGRLGVNECVVLISDGETAAQQLITRLHSTPSLSVNHTLHISLSMVTSLQGESGLELLNRLDEAPLSTH
ncbi:MAG: diguanylate cyclase [Candidatus Planktophila sp.]|nr:diguanylate cyclase [Candidatus Planktophila sp.]